MVDNIFFKFSGVKQNQIRNCSFKYTYQYKKKLYNKILYSLAKKLNEIHKVDFPVRYWEIPLSSWLNFTIVNIYTKWLQVKKIKRKKKTYNIKINHKDLFFRNILEFTSSYSNINYKYINYSNFIYSKIFEKQKIKFKIIKTAKKNKKRDQKNIYFKNLIFFFLIKVKNFFSLKKIILIGFNFNLEKIKLFLNINTYYFMPKYKFIHSGLNKNIRKINLDFNAKNEFEKFLSSNLIKFLPMSFLEDFKLIQKINIRKTNANALIIFTENDCEYIKFFLSESILRNCKIAQSQHGGAYGKLKYLDEEINEINLYDFFLTYGWNYKKALIKEKKKIISFFPLNFKKNITLKRNNGKILIVLDHLPNEFTSFRSILLAEDYDEVILNKLKKILFSLSKEKLKNIDIRLPRINSLNIINSLKLHFPELNLLPANESLHKSFSVYKLIVFTGFYTAILEAIYSNTKMIFLEFEKKNKYRNSFISTYNSLIDNGIIIKDIKKMKLFLSKYTTNKDFNYNHNQKNCLTKFKKFYLNDFNPQIFNKFSNFVLKKIENEKNS